MLFISDTCNYQFELIDGYEMLTILRGQIQAFQFPVISLLSNKSTCVRDILQEIKEEKITMQVQQVLITNWRMNKIIIEYVQSIKFINIGDHNFGKRYENMSELSFLFLTT